MLRYRAVIGTIAVLALGTLAASASAQTNVFRPRVGNALGLVPPVNFQGTFASGPGALAPVTYHGGGVMNHGVEVHLIFWAPPGYAFQNSPNGEPTPGYKGMIEQFFTDVAADSVAPVASDCSTTDPSAECNIFSTLTQYGAQTGPDSAAPGDYEIHFSRTNPDDVIDDTTAYPTDDCTSPQQTKACILDSTVQSEVDSVASAHGNGRGLTNLWYVFTPPDVDECISAGVCETNAFGGYHSLANVPGGGGLTIYAYTGDPIVETKRVDNPGNDPEGNPDAEAAVDIAAHETNEAMTDPEGVGWMDPNGNEDADKCENGPQFGTPLGFASDGSPYNQVINGHQYLIQEIWSNDGLSGNTSQNCVQGTTLTATGLPLPQVNLTQYSTTVTGNIGSTTSDVGVQVTVLRGSGGTQVAQASTTTGADGGWTVTLAHAVGDDRDEIDVDYSGTGAPTPNHQVILTGNGDDPVDEAGWTGWTELDQGAALTNSDQVLMNNPPSLTIAPCFQTGVESFAIDGVAGSGSPTDFCGTASDAADFQLAAPVTDHQVVTYSTNDNRAFQPPDADTPNGGGGLVNLTVTLGEPDSVAAFGGNVPGFTPTGAPACTADLGAQTVTCTGLVPTDTYTLKDGSTTVSGAADANGAVTKSLAVKRNDTVTLSNSVSRTLTTLHVANLQVHIAGDAGTVGTGTCSPLQYWGGPLTTPPTNSSAGEPSASDGSDGVALTGDVCPAGGSAAGMPTSDIAQTDDSSGGETVTEVADVADTSPMLGETLYGAFTAVADTSDGSSPVALSIAPAAGGAAVFTSVNVDSASGVAVPALTPGNYKATWVVTNANGDTRTVTTRFIEESALQGSKGDTGATGPKGPTGPRGPRGPAGPKPHIACHLAKHHKVKCKVTFPKHKHTSGDVRMALARGSKVVALGHGAVKHGRGTVTLRALGQVSRGRWTMTVVFSRRGKATRTTWMAVRVS